MFWYLTPFPCVSSPLKPEPEDLSLRRLCLLRTVVLGSSGGWYLWDKAAKLSLSKGHIKYFTQRDELLMDFMLATEIYSSIECFSMSLPGYSFKGKCSGVGVCMQLYFSCMSCRNRLSFFSGNLKVYVSYDKPHE